MPSSHVRIAVLAVALFLAACVRDSSGPTSPAVAITPLHVAIRPGEVLAITGTGLAEFPASVPALLGTAPLTLTRVDDSTLAGLVPDLPAGAQTLQVTLTDTVASIPFTVLAATTYADPLAATTAILDARLAALPDTAPEGMDSAAWAAESALLDSLIADAKATLGDLTAAEQVALARILAPLLESPPELMTAPTLIGEPDCTTSLTDVAKAGYHIMAGMAASIAAPVTGLFSERFEKTLNAAFSASFMEAKMRMTIRDERCRVPHQIKYTTTGVRGSAMPFEVASAVGPDRFFKGYRMLYPVAGDLRAVSQGDLAKNSQLASTDALYAKARALAVANAAKFPSWMQGLVNSLPPTVAQTPAGPTAQAPLLPSQVRIERVSPASVSLSVGAHEGQLAITSNTTVTTDVPFTYDLVAVADPTVKKTMSGVLRPFMAASFGSSGVVFQGERRVVNIGGFDYGELSCAGAKNLKVTGGDKGVWQEFQWVLDSDKTAPDSTADPLAHVEFEAGEHPFSGSWYFRWRENDAPQYIPFTVGLRVSYFDQVTETIKYSSEFWFTCQ